MKKNKKLKKNPKKNPKTQATLVEAPSSDAEKSRQKVKGVEQLIALGKEKGFLTYDDINRILPNHVTSSEEIDDVLVTLAGQQIAGPAQAQCGAVEALRGLVQPVLDAARQMVFDGVERIEMLLPLWCCELGGRGRRRCAQVSHEVRERDVGLAITDDG